MGLPIRTTLEDLRELATYFATKPTGATIKEAKTVLDSKTLDGRKISALKYWSILEPDGVKLKLTTEGRRFSKGGKNEEDVLINVIRSIPAYNAIIERAAHRNEDSFDTIEVGAHWHDHFRDEVSDNDKILRDQAVCFFHLATGAGLGSLIPGRRGKATRISFSAEILNKYVKNLQRPTIPRNDPEIPETTPEENNQVENAEADNTSTNEQILEENKGLGKSIFIAHGKNTKPLEQLKKILDEFKISYKVAIDEPNLGRPISGKIRAIMQSCNCAILIFTADEEFKDKEGNTIWRPSENVVYELGATAYLYDNRLVILKEEGVSFPSNFRDLGYIEFQKDQLNAKTMDVFKELVGFGILKIST